MKRCIRALCTVLYYGFAKYLPTSFAPWSFGSKHIRAFLCKRMFKSFGHNVNIEHGAILACARQSSIGDHSGIGINSFIQMVDIGDNVMMGPNTLILSVNHEFADIIHPMRVQKEQKHKKVVIEDDVWIGANVIILPGRKIGRGSILGAGAVITKDVQPFSMVGGNPAQVIGWRKKTPDS